MIAHAYLPFISPLKPCQSVKTDVLTIINAPELHIKSHQLGGKCRPAPPANLIAGICQCVANI